VSDNPGLDSIIQQNIQDMLSSPESLPGEFWNYATQHVAQNPVPLQATISPTIIASGVGSSSNTPTRYVGGTTSGAPITGTYVAGDFVVSHDGHVYVCTTTGTPGTWSTWPAQGEISYSEITSPVNVTSTISLTPTTIIAGTSVAYTGAPIYIEIFVPSITTPTVAGGTVNLVLRDTGATLGLIGIITTPTASQMSSPYFAQIKYTPTVANHTLGLSAWTTSTTGTPSIQAGNADTSPSTSAVFPAFLRTRYA
jgi:hypothetical protein